MTCGRTATASGGTGRTFTRTVWLSLTPEECTNLKEQFKVWQQMPQAQKEEARRGYHLYHELPVERRQQALETWQRLRRPPFPVPPVAPPQLHQPLAPRQGVRGHEPIRPERPQALGEPRPHRAGEREQWLKNREYRERLENRPRRQNMAPLREESRQERCRRPGQAERPERERWRRHGHRRRLP